MSYRKDDLLFIKPTEPEECSECHRIAELRPYGRDGTNICVDCGNKDPEETQRQMNKMMKGVKMAVMIEPLQ